MATTYDNELETQDDEEELAKKKKAQLAGEPIGTPIEAPKPVAPPAPDVPQVQPSDATTQAMSTPAGEAIGMPIPKQPTALGSKEYQDATGNLNTLEAQGPPKYHGLKRVLDTIGGATNIGSAIERAGHLGTEGYNEDVGRARQRVADVTGQVTEGQKEQAATSEANLKNAQAGAAESNAQDITVTDNQGNTWRVPKGQASKVIAPVINQTGAGERTAAEIAGREKLGGEQIAGRETVAGIAADAAPKNDFESFYKDFLTDNKFPDTAHNRLLAREQFARAGQAPQQPSTEDKAVSDHLAAQGLPNTPQNRDQARSDILSGKVATQTQAKSEAAVQELGKSAHAAYNRLFALKDENTDPANYAFLMSFIGMSYEAIKGARLNQAEIVRAAATRTLPDQLQHAYDLYIQKRLLTPEQKVEMLRTAKIIAETYPVTEGGSTTGGGGAGATNSGSPKTNDPLGIR